MRYYAALFQSSERKKEYKLAVGKKTGQDGGATFWIRGRAPVWCLPGHKSKPHVKEGRIWKENIKEKEEHKTRYMLEISVTSL